MVPPDEEELEEEGTPCDTASTQEQPAVVPGRPSQQQRSTQTEEVHQLLAETRRTNNLLAARNVEDIAFHARLLEQQSQTSAEVRSLTAAVRDLTGAVNESGAAMARAAQAARADSVPLNEQVVLAVASMMCILQNQGHRSWQAAEDGWPHDTDGRASERQGALLRTDQRPPPAAGTHQPQPTSPPQSFSGRRTGDKRPAEGGPLWSWHPATHCTAAPPAPPSLPVTGHPLQRRRQRDGEVDELLQQMQRTPDVAEARNSTSTRPLLTGGD
ncbi:uncharacterized protein LOC144124814 [Amblyomma americanum]